MSKILEGRTCTSRGPVFVNENNQSTNPAVVIRFTKGPGKMDPNTCLSYRKNIYIII